MGRLGRLNLLLKLPSYFEKFCLQSNYTHKYGDKIECKRHLHNCSKVIKNVLKKIL